MTPPPLSRPPRPWVLVLILLGLLLLAGVGMVAVLEHASRWVWL